MAFDHDIPRTMKLLMTFIDRIGFPILAFLLMAYMFFVNQAKMNEAMRENTLALGAVATQVREHNEWAHEAFKTLRYGRSRRPDD